MTTTTASNKIPLDTMADAIMQAQMAAIASDPGDGNDGGSCCLDTPLIKLGGYRQADIEELKKRTGIDIGEKMKGFWKGYRFLFTASNGQANRRSTMSEAAYRKLAELGIPCHHWQQCD